MKSWWSGSVDGSFFDPDKFAELRILDMPDLKYDERTKKGYYVMGVDVGRLACTTEVVILKVVPVPNSSKPHKEIVNIYSFEEEHFGLQAMHLKQLFNKYKCKACVLDANGLGVGLVDFLVTDQDDPDTGETLWNWGIINDEEGKYRKFQTEETVYNAVYLVKMNRTENSNLYGYVQTQMQARKVKFLIDKRTAEANLMSLEKGKTMNRSKREDYLRPFQETDFFQSQLLNLIRKDNMDGTIILEQSNSRVKKDKFSAFIYAMYWCKMEEEKNKKKRIDVGALSFYTPSSSGQKSLWNL